MIYIMHTLILLYYLSILLAFLGSPYLNAYAIFLCAGLVELETRRNKSCL